MEAENTDRIVDGKKHEAEYVQCPTDEMVITKVRSIFHLPDILFHIAFHIAYCFHRFILRIEKIARKQLLHGG